MTKRVKFEIILATSGALFIYWAALTVTHTKYELINYWWQALLAVVSVLYGIFGLMSAKHWSWLKSGVGRGVFMISLGVVMWGIGQAGWTYYVIKDPAQQSPPTHIVDVLYSSSIPMWTYGIFMLSKATGARYGLKSAKAKLIVVLVTIAMFIFSYIILVNVARGGTAYFHQPFWTTFFDLGYAAGDVVNLILAATIFGLSWRYLGGRFKKPILVILLAFALLYMADFWFSYVDGKGQYYNGDWVDLLYLLTIAVFGLGLCMLDPSSPVRAILSPALPATPVDTPSPEFRDTLTPAMSTPAMPETMPEAVAQTFAATPVQTMPLPTPTVEPAPTEVVPLQPSSEAAPVVTVPVQVSPPVVTDVDPQPMPAVPPASPQAVDPLTSPDSEGKV